MSRLLAAGLNVLYDLKSFLTVWSLREIRAAVVTSSSVGLTARSVKVRLQRERQVKHPEALTSLLLLLL